MTSKLFWNAFRLYDLLFKKYYYAHPITFDLATKCFSVDKWTRAKFLPIITSYCLVVFYSLLTCFNGILCLFENIPVHYSLINIWFTGISWNLLFITAAFLSKPGYVLIESFNTLLKEELKNKRQNEGNSRKNQQDSQVTWSYIFTCFVKGKGKNHLTHFMEFLI